MAPSCEILLLHYSKMICVAITILNYRALRSDCLNIAKGVMASDLTFDFFSFFFCYLSNLFFNQK